MPMKMVLEMLLAMAVPKGYDDGDAYDCDCDAYAMHAYDCDDVDE